MAQTRAPLGQVTAVLVELHGLAGAPSHRQLSGYTSAVSATTLYQVLRGQGDHRPKTIDAFLFACLEYAKQHRRFARLSEEQWSLGYWRERYDQLNTPRRPDSPVEVNLLTGAPVWTRYREQVRRITPAQLVGRESELAELAAFGAAPGEAYAYWRAEPWSGKSALLSWFVLHPPAGVRIVSFFITARLASQNDRVAFIDNVVEQLSTLLGQDTPAFLTEATREPYLLGLLADAAKSCRDRGERLVLLVDGLDEDRGVTVGPNAHSIAALLPAQPPAGMRVIVSGRPNPPIPWDVPDHHPLHDPGIVRVLSPSPQAQALRADMERELKNLLYGTQAEQDLLGVLTATGGGLTIADLAALTGQSDWTVRDHLRTVLGRTFTLRASAYQPGIAPEVYLLGHEELQATAHDVLGPARLAAYRQRVHTWAEGYQERGWPDDTPEYLLLGYFDLLPGTGDLPRMVACATDPARQDRLLEASWDDFTAIGQIVDAQYHVLAQDPPDLTAMVRLAIHRDYLLDRSTHLPTELPAVWVTLGQPNRAEALASSITDPGSQTSALLAIAAALAAAGNQDRAVEVLTEATAVAHDKAWPGLTPIVDMMIKLGELGRAEGLASLIAHPHEKCAALTSVVTALVRAGESGHAAEVATHAEALTRTTTTSDQTVDRRWKTSARVSVAEALLEVGERHRAAEILDEVNVVHPLDDVDPVMCLWVKLGEYDRAKDLARSVFADPWDDPCDDPDDQVLAQPTLIRTMAEAGDVDRAEALAGAGNAALESVVTALVEAGDIGRAETLAHSITDPVSRTRSLVAVTTAMVTAGDVQRTTELIDYVQAHIRSIPDAYHQSLALTSAAEALFAAGVPDRANELIDQAEARADDAETDPDLLTSIAKVLANAGEVDRATVLVRQAERKARTQTYRFSLTGMVTSLARALAEAGDFDRAETVARILTPYERREALTAVACAMAKAGELDRAETAARSVTGRYSGSEPVISVATAMAEAGAFDRAERLAWTLVDPSGQTVILTSVVAALLVAGQRDRAIELATQLGARMSSRDHRHIGKTLLRTLVEAGEFDCAEALAGAISDPSEQSAALASVARAMAAAGERDSAAELITHAETLARSHPQCEAFSAIAQALDALGERYRASDMITEAEAVARFAMDTFWPDRTSLALVARALVEMGEFDRAEAVARDISDVEARDEVWTSLPCAMANVGEFDRAEVFVRDRTWIGQSEAVAALVEAMVEAGEFDRAETLVRSIDIPSDQVDALRVLAAHNHPCQAAEAARIINESSRWHDALNVMVRLEPTVLDTILTELDIVDRLT